MRSLLTFVLAFLAVTLMAQDFPASFRQIDALTEEGKYRTALQRAGEVSDQALAADRQDHMARALGYRVALLERLEEDGEQAAADLLRGEIAAHPDLPVYSALAHLLLGETVYQFAQRNGWRLSELRTAGEGAVSDTLPLVEYGMAELIYLAQRHVYRALELTSDHTTPLAEIPGLVAGSDLRISEVPTLYDLVVDRAMQVLGGDLSNVMDDRPLDGEALLVPAAAFCDIDLSLNYDMRRGSARKLQVYQQWLCGHLDEGGPALLYADLERMAYVRQLDVPDSSYFQALESMYDRYAGVPIRDRILVEMARVLDRDDTVLGDRPRARALALLDRVGEEDPVARVTAAEVRAGITARTVDVQVESYHGLRQHILAAVGYRNVERLYYRVYAIDAAEGLQPSYRSDRLLQDLRGRRVAASGSQLLAANDDYSPHSTELDLDPLPAGAYRMLVADREDVSTEGVAFSVVDFQVTDMAVVKVNEEDASYLLVTDRTTGAPLAGITVDLRRENRRGDFRSVTTRTSAADGTFRLPRSDNYANYQLVLTNPNSKDRLVSNAYDYNRSRGSGRATDFTTLLTDRPLYRPGQTVRVYGLRYRKDKDGLPSVLPNDALTVVLRDANYQEVAQRAVTSDAFGRFSLRFELPEGGLTGEFSLQTDNGTVFFRVEEYKRPRFAVTYDDSEPVAPGAETTVRGTALTYAGPAVAEGQVSYRVYLEEVRYYFGWFRGNPGGDGRELLTSGTTTTDADGRFTVPFTAPEIRNADSFRRYRFVVEADVTDATGETHEATTSIALRGDRPAVVVAPERASVDRGDRLTLNWVRDGEAAVAITVRIVPVDKPNAALLERNWEIPDRPVIDSATFARHFPLLAYGPVPALDAWPATGAEVYSRELTLASPQDTLSLPADFPVGHYRVEFTYPDGTAGEPTTFSVYDATANALPEGVLYQLDQVTDSVVVDQPVTYRLLTAVDVPLILSRWQSRRGIEDARKESEGSVVFTYTPTDADRGGLTFDFAFVRFGRAFAERRRLELPWDNKKLEVTYATFRDRLRPGEPEQWTIELRTPDGEPAAAAALATMYDASLDQLYGGPGWAFAPYPEFYGGPSLTEGGSFGSVGGRRYGVVIDRPTDTLPDLPALQLPWTSDHYGPQAKAEATGAIRMRGMSSIQNGEAVVEEAEMDASADMASPAPPPAPPAVEETGQTGGQEPVQIRTNLQETAFWLPELTATEDGALRISFTTPEALTAWKFRLFSHDKALRYVISEREIVTQKDLMVLPNVPRFLREGDAAELTARVSNLTAEALDVTATLELFNPTTGRPVSLQDFIGREDAGAVPSGQAIKVAGNGTSTVRFPLSVPEGKALDGPLGYRIVVRGGNFSDGEENVLPVLSDRTLVTASVPFYLRRGDRKTIKLPLLADYRSNSLEHVSYTFEATTNPAWLALKALPYLMEYPYDCTEQLANRYFANQLAYVTVSSKPVLEEVFTRWQADSTALLSELERNQDLKTALLTETPWVREAQSEAEQRARIGELFQLKRLAKEQKQALAKLAARQKSDGAYSWFPGGRSDVYMTQYVLETLSRMRQLGVIGDEQQGTVDQITSRAVRYLDRQTEEAYERLFAETRDSVKLRDEYVPSATQIHYLYARGPLGTPESKSLKFFRDRAFAEWTQYGLYEQALIALTAAAAKNELAETILASLRERALHHDEFGMYWKYEQGFRWNKLPIETHTRILEAFRTIDPRAGELEDMRLWLLTNKRTNRWPTTKATAAAVYALLNGEGNFAVGESTEPIEVRWPAYRSGDLGTRVLAQQQAAEAATGAFSLRLDAAEVNRDLATVRVTNPGNDLVWGGVYWQYTEVAQRVEASNAGPLTLRRELFRRRGDQLTPFSADEALQPGDRVTVRLTVSSDREMDYVHVKDRRAATFEPVQALSGYRYDNGLGYYFAPGDLATNFFIDHLPKGTFTLEYDLFTTFAGSFSNGLGRVECMYAPEFGGNTAGSRVVVE